jgi:hypothetical protein
MTRTIARGGALVAVSVVNAGCEFVDGEEIEIEIELDRNPAFEQKCIYCQGTITRVDLDGPGVARIAIEFNTVAFRKPKYSGIHGECRSIT